MVGWIGVSQRNSCQLIVFLLLMSQHFRSKCFPKLACFFVMACGCFGVCSLLFLSFSCIFFTVFSSSFCSSPPSVLLSFLHCLLPKLLFSSLLLLPFPFSFPLPVSPPPSSPIPSLFSTFLFPFPHSFPFFFSHSLILLTFPSSLPFFFSPSHFFFKFLFFASATVLFLV